VTLDPDSPGQSGAWLKFHLSILFDSGTAQELSPAKIL